MRLIEVQDLAYNLDGDIFFQNVDENKKDLVSISGLAALKQHINTRMVTFLGTCQLWQELGNEIDLMRGKRNTRENGLIIKEKIIKCLTFGNIFDIIDVSMIPMEDNMILYHLSLSFEDGIIFNMQINFDFENGIGWSI